MLKFIERTPVIYGIFALAVLFLVNGPNIHRPPFDHHSFRQCQTLSTVEIYFRDGIDLLYPKTNYVGEPGVLVLEFPIFQAFCAMLYHLFGQHLIIIRALNIFITLLSGGMVYVIARKLFDNPIAAASGLFFVTAPLNLMFMSSTLIDPFGVLLALLSLYAGIGSTEATGRCWVWRVWLILISCLLGVIKALYLFPTVLFFAFLILNRKTFKTGLAGYGALVPAGLCFLAWGYHAHHANNASAFTAGLAPTTPLGISKLLALDWYIVIGKRLLWECIGPLAGPLAIMGWIWAGARVISGVASGVEKHLLLIGAICIGYWALFANINFPHNYYSLLVVPFLSIAAAAALLQLLRHAPITRENPSLTAATAATLATLGALAAYLFFSDRRGFPSAPEILTLQVTAGKEVQAGNYAILLISRSRLPEYGAALHDVPAALYAVQLRGTAKLVNGSEQALEVWRELAPKYRNLRYAIFYGLPPPSVLHAELGRPIISDVEAAIYVFELDPQSRTLASFPYGSGLLMAP